MKMLFVNDFFILIIVSQQQNLRSMIVGAGFKLSRAQRVSGKNILNYMCSPSARTREEGLGPISIKHGPLTILELYDSAWIL